MRNGVQQSPAELFRFSQQAGLLCSGAQFNAVQNEGSLSRKRFEQIALGQCQVLIRHAHCQNSKRFALCHERQMQCLRARKIIGKTPCGLALTKCPIRNTHLFFGKSQGTVRMLCQPFIYRERDSH